MISQYANYRLIVMSKAPEPGYVKTRMQPYLTKNESAELHQALVRYCLQQWQLANVCPLQFWVGGKLPLFQQQCLSGIPSIENSPLYAQAEGDLGDRMSAAITMSLSEKDVEGIVIVGTDCPFITREYLQEAIESLQCSSCDLVIGPAADGGYVLLAMKECYRALFCNVPWGTDKVCEITLQIAQSLSLRYQLLPTLNDIDEYGDLAFLGNRHFPETLRRFSK